MREPPSNVLEFSLVERAEMAFKAAVEEVMEEHARLGLPIYVWRDGKVVEIPASELQTSSPDKP